MLGGSRAGASAIAKRAVESVRRRQAQAAGASAQAAGAPAAGAPLQPARVPAQGVSLPTVRASGRPKSDVVAGIAFGGNFRGHIGRKPKRGQASQALAKVGVTQLVRQSQPVVAPTQQATAGRPQAEQGSCQGKGKEGS